LKNTSFGFKVTNVNTKA